MTAPDGMAMPARLQIGSSALHVSIRHWRRAQGNAPGRPTREEAMVLDRVAVCGLPSAETPPTRASLDSMPVAIAHQIQEEVSIGEGSDEDVDRIA